MGGEAIMDDLALKRIEELEAKIELLEAEKKAISDRLAESENQLTVALSQIIIMKSERTFDAPSLQ